MDCAACGRPLNGPTIRCPWCKTDLAWHQEDAALGQHFLRLMSYTFLGAIALSALFFGLLWLFTGLPIPETRVLGIAWSALLGLGLLLWHHSPAGHSPTSGPPTGASQTRTLGTRRSTTALRNGHVATMHTDTVEGVWSLFKRSVTGSYHKLSAKHLGAYLDELEWRFNNRKNPYLFRDTLIRILNSPTLEYKALTS